MPEKTDKMPIAVIILTFNEEANIEAALDSVEGWASEVFVVDSYSTDRTVDIALAHAKEGVKVIQHAFENYSAQWNWALKCLPVTQPWIFKLDADERATEAFRNEVGKRITDPDNKETAFIVHWRLIFMGRRLRFGGWYPNGTIRIWRKGQAYFQQRETAEHIVARGKISEIKNPIDHHDKKSLGYWIERHNRYSSMEAREIITGNITGEIEPRFFGRHHERRMWLRRVYFRAPFRALFYFLYRFVFRLGFLDGAQGFRIAFLHAAFFYWIDLKIQEYRKTGVLPEVIWPERGRPYPEVANSPLQKHVESLSTDNHE